MIHLRAAGMERMAAIIQGNRDRIRPILMTTLALVAGMMPLALGSGPGAEERRAIAVVVIGGQTLALLLTLLATPVVYALLDELGQGRASAWGHVPMGKLGAVFMWVGWRRHVAPVAEPRGHGTDRLAANVGARQHSTTALLGQPVRNQDDAHIHDIRLSGAGDE
jgi:hypothetical protein